MTDRAQLPDDFLWGAATQVDFQTQERTIKESGRFYAGVIEANSVSRRSRERLVR